MKMPSPSRPQTLQRVALASAISMIWASPSYSATIIVDDNCSLIEAIDSANSTSPLPANDCEVGGNADTIVLADGSDIILDSVNNTNDGSNGLPQITSEITIQVTDGGTASIRRSTTGSTPEFRLLHINNQGNLTLSGITLSGGALSTGSLFTGAGGAILNQEGILTLEHSNLSENIARFGGGIMNTGSLSLSNSSVSDNSTFFIGGGIFNTSASIDATIRLTNSTVSGNEAGSKGGGMYILNGTTTLTDSTVSGNSASNGGGIFNAHSANNASLTLSNSTISGNTATVNGGGIYNNDNIATLDNSTVSANSAAYGGGVFNTNTGTTALINSTIAGNSAALNGSGIADFGGVTVLRNSIIANGTGGMDCVKQGLAVINATNNSLIEDGTCAPALTGDPLLGPLADNGGPTLTHALLAGSPAIDAGDATACSDAPVKGLDQRGVARPQGAACDIGAYERVDSSFFAIPVSGGKTVIFSL